MGPPLHTAEKPPPQTTRARTSPPLIPSPTRAQKSQPTHPATATAATGNAKTRGRGRGGREKNLEPGIPPPQILPPRESLEVWACKRGERSRARRGGEGIVPPHNNGKENGVAKKSQRRWKEGGGGGGLHVSWVGGERALFYTSPLPRCCCKGGGKGDVLWVVLARLRRAAACGE